MSGEKKSMDSAVLAAIITVTGGIIVALITTFANRLPASKQTEPSAVPTWTQVPTSTIANTPVPTDTVPAGEPTSTPAPPTATVAPSDTPQPPALGEDWANGCISSLWQVVPAGIQAVPENGCLQQPVGDFTASNGRFSFLLNRKFSSAQVDGMFAPLSAEGTVSLKVHLDILEKGEVWMGVFSEPSIDSPGVIMVIPPGDVTKRLLVMKTMPGQSKGAQSQQYNQSSAVYDVKFTYKVGSVAVSAMNNSMVLNPVPVASPKKWLFIGYQASNGVNNIGASFFDLALQ
jgi:hypothetical protein